MCFHLTNGALLSGPTLVVTTVDSPEAKSLKAACCEVNRVVDYSGLCSGL